MRIAIVGTGISGLGAAYLLHEQHDITVYEKNPYIGGHSRTVDVQTGKATIPVDTGFIVFNYRNYPLLSGLFKHLHVPVEPGDMSFAASIDHGWFEYGTQHISNLFGQKKNLARPAFWRMIRDILRFNKQALDYLNKDSAVTLGQCLDELGLGEWFRRYYILAMGGAIWSCPLDQMLQFPAKTFVRFFDNHGLLTVNDQPQWYTVSGGSREYVARLTQNFGDRIRIGCSVMRVIRNGHTIEVHDSRGGNEIYDHIIFACHSDQALAMLAVPTDDEEEILGCFQYQGNVVILHSDASFMPRNKQCWASWVYQSETRKDKKPAICLSYWMNRLQNLESDVPIIVTLNPMRRPDEALIHDEYTFEHPVFDQDAIEAQSRLDNIQGTLNTWYCGAYHRYGFHEDGLWSAVHVAKQLGAEIPWH